VILALATPAVATSVSDALEKVEQAIAEAGEARADVVCFPEAYLPGLRGLDFPVADFSAADERRALARVTRWARAWRVTTVLGMEHVTPAGRQIVSAVIASDGTWQGFQGKTQLDPSEEAHYVPAQGRRLFQAGGVPFGISICHEGFRYPETVRWAAVRGAKLVLHPHCTGSDQAGRVLTEWGSSAAPYYERAMMCRGLENTVWFAGVNYAFRYQDSATALISPTGECVAWQPYGAAGVLVREIDPEAATGLLASRYAPERYAEQPVSA
jgi:predicted amidohydrolase